jgi:hypothetical protein
MKREHFTPLNVAIFLCPIIFAVFLLNYELWPKLYRKDVREIFTFCLTSSLTCLVLGNLFAWYVMHSNRFANPAKTTARFYAAGFLAFLLLTNFLGPN